LQNSPNQSNGQTSVSINNHQHIGHTIPSSLQQGSAAGTFSQRNQGAAAQRLKKLNVPYKNIEIAEPKNQGDDGDDQMFHYNSL
jgi:hypothetical protein